MELRDSEILTAALSKTINTRNDLKKSAPEHWVKSELYNGDAIDWIYQSLGDSRGIKQLTIICEKRPWWWRTVKEIYRIFGEGA